MPDLFDRTLGGLHGVPDVLCTKPATIQTVSPLLGNVQTFILQTYRHVEQGETIFLQFMNGDSNYRLVIPAKVAEAIGRQHDLLGVKLRRKIARQQAAERKERGVVPFAKKA